MNGEHKTPSASPSEENDLVAWARSRVANRQWTINAERLNAFADEIERLRNALSQSVETVKRLQARDDYVTGCLV